MWPSPDHPTVEVPDQAVSDAAPHEDAWLQVVKTTAMRWYASDPRY
jgi:hypothetical protein